MSETTRKQNSLLSGVVASAIAAAVLAVTNFFTAKYLPLEEHFAALLSAVIGAILLVLALYLRGVKLYEIVGRKYLDANTGIIRVYPSLRDASEDLKAGFEKARRVDLLLHIGRREFAGRDGLFTELLRSRVVERDFELRILQCAETSPYLSEEQAKLLGKDRTKWLVDLRYVADQIRVAAANQKNVQIAPHFEPFVWRMFIFDNEMFVSGYLHQTRNDELAPVFKIRLGPNSLYAPFRAYYDHLWRLYAVNA